MKSKVRIITSLNHYTTEDDIANYSDNGIDEFYFGFMPKEWTKEYGWEISTNRRPYPTGPHLTGWQKAQRLIETAQKKKKKMYLALNEHQYCQEQYRLLIPLLRRFIELGIDGILVADLALITYLKANNYKIPLHLSIGGGVFNSQTVKFFHELGLERIVLPRKITLEEIKQIIDASAETITFEVFLAGEWCRYSDAYCFNVHGYDRNELCKLRGLDRERTKPFFSHRFLKEKTNYPWCGLCMIPRLKNYLGRIVFKLPLRSDVFKDKLLTEEIIPLIKKGILNDEVFKNHLKCHEELCTYEFT